MPYNPGRNKIDLSKLSILVFMMWPAVSVNALEPIISSYLGGVAADKAFGIKVDSTGCFYVSGMTSSPDFPVINPFDSTFGGLWDAFVGKISNSGGWLEYSTYLGGADGAQGYDIAIDRQGCAYITGKTNSADFPTAGPYESSYSGGGDVFVTKFAPDGGSLVFSMFIGGSGEDWGKAIYTDSEGIVYVIGSTSSTDFPLAGAIDSTYNGGADIFITVISSAGDSILFSTYLGGTSDDFPGAIAVGDNGAIYLGGRTRSADFPQVNPGFAYAGASDAFVSRISSPPRAIQFSTFFGGGGNDEARCLAVSNQYKLTVAGWTDSGDFPTVAPLDSSHNGLKDVFLAIFDLATDSLEFSTYWGGAGQDEAFSLCLTDAGDVIIVGETGSVDFPLVAPTDGTLSGSSDALICRFEYPQLTPNFSSYYGGGSGDAAYGIAVDQYGCLYICGFTSSTDLPLLAPLDSTFSGVVDAFYVKFASGNGLAGDDSYPVPFTYLSCYPNPFNAQTAIEYTLPEKSHVRLDIYDIQGKLVETLVDLMQPAGYHSVTWSVNSTPSGIYFYRLIADRFSRTRKMVLLK